MSNTPSPARAVVLVTGDEVLEGRVGDRNGRFLTRELYAAGVELERVEFLSDRVEQIQRHVRAALDEGVDLVVTTGGLGVTHDDLTMQAVANAVGVRLTVDPAVADEVRRQCATHPRWPHIAPAVQDANVIKQAALPEGAVVIPPVGTAPGAIVEAPSGALIVVLAGPPTECVPMWRWTEGYGPIARLLSRSNGDGRRVVRITGAIESQIVEFLAGCDPVLLQRVRMGICAQSGEVEVTIRQAVGSDAVEHLADLFVARFHDQIISLDDRDLDTIIAEELTARRQTVAVAESCTGGLLGARLTARPGSSAYVRGGVISYDNSVKVGVLGVNPEVIERDGAVSAACAIQMAEGVRRTAQADIGVSITGIAGPGGGSPDKPVGTVFIAAADAHGTEVRQLHLRGERDAVRERSVGQAMQLLFQRVVRR